MTASLDEISDYIAAQGADFASRAPDLPFTRGEYADRLARLRKKMADEHIDTVLLTAPDTMCWLHGFTTRWYRSHSSTKLPRCTARSSTSTTTGSCSSRPPATNSWYG
ncbi:aminopeptidase P family N-terminal domain-containing protein [Streptomyces malaysiensis subsp. malaysiensis]